MLTDAELLHQAAATVRRLATVTTGTLMDALTRWCRDDPGRVRTLVGQVVAHANGGQPDSGLAYDRVVAAGPAALAALMDRYAAELDRTAMMDIMNTRDTAIADLVAFVRARLDEDEQIARAAITPVGDRWQVEYGAKIEVVSDSDYQIVVYDEGAPTPEQARHIVRHDPARVLAEVEAKRRIIEIHQHYPAQFSDGPAAFGCGICDTSTYGAEITGAGWCDTLKALALPYADHEDYRPEWRPDDAPRP